MSQFRTILFRRNLVDVGNFDNDVPFIENGTFASGFSCLQCVSPYLYLEVILVC